MAKTTKTWKIGEYAIGGKIKVTIYGKVIMIKVLDYYTDKEVASGTGTVTDYDIRGKIRKFLEDHTTYYYADQILKWIESKIKLNQEGIFKNIVGEL